MRIWMLSIICSFICLATFAAKGSEVNIVDFDGRSFADGKDREKIELAEDAAPAQIEAYARRKTKVAKAGHSKIFSDKEVLQLQASDDPFGHSLFIKFKNDRRARLTNELIAQKKIDVLLDQVRAGAFPDEDLIFIHDKESGKIAKLSPFLDQLSRQKELEEGDYEGIGGTFRSLMDRIKGIGVYAEQEDDSVDDSDRAPKEEAKEARRDIPVEERIVTPAARGI